MIQRLFGLIQGLLGLIQSLALLIGLRGDLVQLSADRIDLLGGHTSWWRNHSLTQPDSPLSIMRTMGIDGFIRLKTSGQLTGNCDARNCDTSRQIRRSADGTHIRARPPGYTQPIADRSWCVSIIEIIHRAARFQLRQPCFHVRYRGNPGGCSAKNSLRGWE